MRRTLPPDQDRSTDANGFQMIPSCALNAMTAGLITPSAYATLAAVISFMGADRTAYMYRRTIAAKTGQSVKTVARHLAMLTEAGLLQVTTDPYRGASLYSSQDPCENCLPTVHLGTLVSPPRDTSDTHRGTRSSELDQSSDDENATGSTEAIEAQIDERIGDQCDHAERRGGITNPAAYRRTALANQDDRERHRADIIKEQRQRLLEEVIESCTRCDAAGLRTLDDGAQVETRVYCSHEAEAVKDAV